jgi:hypothetical protein
MEVVRKFFIQLLSVAPLGFLVGGEDNEDLPGSNSMWFNRDYVKHWHQVPLGGMIY